MVVEAQKKTLEISTTIEDLRRTHTAIKEANDSRVHAIQEENRNLDSELAAKESKLNVEERIIEDQIYEARAKLLRRIILCNLKNKLSILEPIATPDNALSIIYSGKFALVYDIITQGGKPVNKCEYKVSIKLRGQTALNSLLNVVWPPYKETYWGWRDDLPRYFQRDFKSEEDARTYGERNRARVCQPLIEGMKQLEQEIEAATTDIDEVFDFRLTTSSALGSGSSRDRQFKIVSAEKHKLILAPFPSSWERDYDEIKPYTVTVTQQNYQLTIENHRFAGEARDLSYAIRNYFTTDFQAIEADTHQEIPNPY
jgi:hypothetical protein